MTTSAPYAITPPVLDPEPLQARDILEILRLGWRDFAAAPQYGLFFAAVYVGVGLFLVQLRAGHFTWVLTLSLGFPLIAPFLAVGLYEVSRRLETGATLRFPSILAIVWEERNRQIPWAGAVIVVYFLFWSFFAHMLFALFMGPSAFTGPPSDLSTYLSGAGLRMLAAEAVTGAALAFLLFGLTVISLPMLLDREVDFITAMRLSLRATAANKGPMALWAFLIAALTFLALIPGFVGLLVVLPVLGHASWHLYRRCVLPA